MRLSPDVEEIDLASEISSSSTLAAAILPGTSTLIHATATAVTLWEDLKAGKSAAIWQAPAEITSAQVYQDYIVASTVGGDVHILKATSASLERVAYVLSDQIT